MTEILSWMNPTRWLMLAAAAGALVVGVFAWQQHERGVGREEGRREVQAKWDRETAQLNDAAPAKARENAKETLRRVDRQQENQHAQDLELASARADAARNAADADRVRDQSAAAARDWGRRLADPPSREALEAAGSAIGVLTDLLGRADRRAGILASYADAARAAGLKCERDYDSLTSPKQHPVAARPLGNPPVEGCARPEA